MVKTLQELASIALLRLDDDAITNLRIPESIRDLLREIDVKLVIKGKADAAKIRDYCREMQDVLSDRKEKTKQRAAELKALARARPDVSQGWPERREFRRRSQQIVDKFRDSATRYLQLVTKIDTILKSIKSEIKKLENIDDITPQQFKALNSMKMEEIELKKLSKTCLYIYRSRWTIFNKWAAVIAAMDEENYNAFT